MTSTDGTSAHLTLKFAGIFQEIKDTWAKRLNQYFQQMESLVEGQWLTSNDIAGIIKESKTAAREALDGLGSDLSAELLHISNGLATRFNAERESLNEEINDLRRMLTLAMSGHEHEIRSENQALRIAILEIPQFMVLSSLQLHSRATYDLLSEDFKIKKTQIRKHVKSLVEKGYVSIDKKTRPHSVIFLSAPWRKNIQHIETEEVVPTVSTQTHLSTL